MLVNDDHLCYVDLMRKGIVCMSVCNVQCDGMMMWMFLNGEIRVMCNAGCVETDCQEQDCLLKNAFHIIHVLDNADNSLLLSKILQKGMIYQNGLEISHETDTTDCCLAKRIPLVTADDCDVVDKFPVAVEVEEELLETGDDMTTFGRLFL